MALALEELLGDATDPEPADRVHDDPLVARFYGVLEADFVTGSELPSEVQVDILHVADEIVTVVVPQANIVRFWHNAHAQDSLRRQIIHILDQRDDLFPFEEQSALADRLMELARANRALISARADEGARS